MEKLMKKLLLNLSVCLTTLALSAQASDYSLLDTSLDCNGGNVRLSHRKSASNVIGADPCLYEINDQKYEEHGHFNALTVETCDVSPEHALLITRFNVLPENNSLIRALNTFFIAVANSKDPRKQYTTVYAWIPKIDQNNEESIAYLILKNRLSFQEDSTVLKDSVHSVKIPMTDGVVQLKATVDNIKRNLIRG